MKVLLLSLSLVSFFMMYSPLYILYVNGVRVHELR